MPRLMAPGYSVHAGRRGWGGPQSRGRPGSVGAVHLLRLGPAEDDPAVPGSGRHPARRHRRHGPPRRRRLLAADRRRQAQGIIVTSQNTELPTSFGKYQGKGFGYVGAVNYTAGYNLGKEAVARFALQSGDRAMVWGLLSQPSRGERTKGVIDALEEAGLTVDYLEIDAATNADPTAGTPTFTGYVSSNPDVKLVVTDHGGLTATLETYLKAAGKGADDIYGAGFDLSPATLAAIRGGWTDLVIDQQPWLQGYLPILQICLTKVYGFSGLMIDTGAGFADKDNIEFLAPLAEKEIR